MCSLPSTSPCEELIDVVGHLLVEGDDVVEVLGRESRLGRLGHPEEFGVVSRQIGHPFLDRVEYRLFRLEDLLEEARVVVMDLHPAGGHRLEFPRGVDDLLRHALVEVALWRHAAHDARAADCDVAVLVGQEQGRAYALVAAARRVRPVDRGEHGDAQLVQLCVPEERGAVAPPVGVDLLLLGQLDATAVNEPDERAVEPFRDVGDPEDVVRLACDPRPRHDLVVEADYHAPPAVYPAETVNYARSPRFLVHVIVQQVQGRPGAFVEDVLEALMDRPFAPLLEDFSGKPGVLLLLQQFVDLRLDLLDLLGIRRVFFHGFPEWLHFFEVRSHPYSLRWVSILL